MKRILLLFGFIGGIITLSAQTWNEGFQNQPFNLRHESLSPTRIAWNPMRNFSVADVNYHLQRGDFRPVDHSPDSRTLSVSIGGLRHLGKFDLQGRLRYHNLQDKAQRWNSTLWNNPRNPFVLCDSVPSDVSTESFDMQAAVAYSFDKRFSGGLEVGLQTGSRADQTDPRPRTSSVIIPITASIDYRLYPDWHVALSAIFRLFNSHVEYYNVHPLSNHTYFLMKGMGDYIRRSTGDLSGYQRDYKGTSCGTAIEMAWLPENGNHADFLELSFSTSTQDANDGGSAYSFHGGDYSEQTLSLRNRLQLKHKDNMLHNLTLAASYAAGKGTWYEQKRQTDLEHGNIPYYIILSKNTNYKSQHIEASLRYQLDLLRNGRRNIFLDAQAGMMGIVRKSFLGDLIPRQTINRFVLGAKIGRCFHVAKAEVVAEMGGKYTFPLTKKYDDASYNNGGKDISSAYTRFLFDYETSRNLQTDASIDVGIPVGKDMTMGMAVGCGILFHVNSKDQPTIFGRRNTASVSTGLYLKF